VSLSIFQILCASESRLLLPAPPSLLQAPPNFENIPNTPFMKLRFYPYRGGWVWLGKVDSSGSG